MLRPKELRPYLPSMTYIYVAVPAHREVELLKLTELILAEIKVRVPLVKFTPYHGSSYDFLDHGKCIGPHSSRGDLHSLVFLALDLAAFSRVIESIDINMELYIWLNKYSSNEKPTTQLFYGRHWVPIIFSNVDKIMKTRTITL